jgi:hypothetical protein
MEIPHTLENRLRARKVIPFIGAGVFMAVLERESGSRLFPSWKELLERAADRLEGEKNPSYANLVRSLLAIGKPDYLDAARRAGEGLGPSGLRFCESNWTTHGRVRSLKA